jgi:aquaporin NIP
MKKYIAEMIGTYALVFCGTGAIVINNQTHGAVGHIGIAITFGLIVMAMIYSFGNISGAHFNPAVTLGFAITGLFNKKEILPYIVSQLIGAILASHTLHLLFPKDFLLGATIPAGSDAQSLVLEFILTFFLMLVILFTSQGAKEVQQLAGLAIGGVVLLEAMFAGPISGASMNPARSAAPAIVSANIEHLWVYIAGPFGGAVMAVVTWKFAFSTKSVE